MALPPPLSPRPSSEPFSHHPGAPRELDTAEFTIYPASGDERIRLEQAQKQGQVSLDPPEHFQSGLRGTKPATGLPTLPTSSSQEDPTGAKHCKHSISGQEVLEAEQDSLHLSLLGLGLQLQDLERGLGPWASAQSGMVQLQVFEEINTLEQDLEVEGDSDGPGHGRIWGPWASGSLPTPAELEWDPAGDVGGLGPLGRRTAWTPGAPCELCGHRGPWGRGQSLEVRAGGVTSPRAPMDPSVCLLAGSFPFKVFMALFLPLSLSGSISLLLSHCPLPSLPLPLLASMPSSISLCFLLLYLHFLISSHSLPHSPLGATLFQIHSHLKAPSACPAYLLIHSSLLRCYLFREACSALQILLLLVL
ncbi:Nesprin-4 [Camelus dromedarius]|uniref:Nesprin-4 n=1 Tax=Camelus dromedarius TaxID=9838 RepID=A0A5N4DSM0_CAMDR|nr:nesprin-4 isoform X3 [Camelus dromedarius]KAB1273970.1 Nesprin-4 [Camelus dromedarius]